jgi:hypothetical protein
MDPRIEGARDLIVAIFRLAVADYLGLAFNHDSLGPVRRTRRSPYVEQAGLFLASAWAAYLADLIGLHGSAIWREARKPAESHCDQVSRRPIAA